MTLVTEAYLEDLEDLAEESDECIYRTYTNWVWTTLDEQYEVLHTWIQAFYGTTEQDYVALSIDGASPSYALLIPFMWFGEVLLERKTRRAENYQVTVKPQWIVPLQYGMLNLYDIVNVSSELYIELTLSGKYLSIREMEKEYTSPGPMAPPRLLPTLLL